jgi:hypothetical protein
MRGKTPEHVTFQLEESKKTITNELYVAAASNFMVWTEAAAVSADSSANRAEWTLAASSLSRDVIV